MARDYETITSRDNQTDLDISSCTTIDEVRDLLERSGYRYDHSATCDWRLNIGTIWLKSYRGRFGEGITLHEHLPRNQRHHTISYYIREEKEA